ncbi:hypothetical protein L3Q82_012933 [Scortum barcoo]|uniref:Uncharacterized protein n=1 Tax=Scortum barcoo TaxID=214431 RepID=A0ACB8W139_9TELE|nr:hypothetical protein L3Q82_012933 [Scortum barcoo]
MNCIKSHWDEEDEKKNPQLPSVSVGRPSHRGLCLLKNTMLAVLVEELKKTGLQAAPADHCYAGPEDVACDVLHWEKTESCQVLSGHDTVSAAAERTERQRELEVSRQNIQQRIQDREKDVKELQQQEVEAINRSADKAVKDSEKIFSQLIRLSSRKEALM